MNILMMTNTYKPLLGGLEKSVEFFSKEFRAKGHRVVIVTPECDGMEPEEDVVRIPALHNFNGSNFSVQLPIANGLEDVLESFHPDIVHSHHPFLIGDTALRVASKYNVPLVFTHHTLYEENVHYLPGNEESLKRFVIELSTGYANLADQVFFPSESVMHLAQERGVHSKMEVVPTGIDVKVFARGAGKAFRKKFNIPADAFVIGHIGRLAPEKNLEFLMRAAAQFLNKNPAVHLLIAGKGPSEETMREILTKAGVIDRLHCAGVVKGKDLVDAYHAMDTFMCASQSETQGLVITEAMAAGVPVVAVDAPGIREVVQDRTNGRLLTHESIEDFDSALEWVFTLPKDKLSAMKKACKQTAGGFSMDKISTKVLGIYAQLSIQAGFCRKPSEESDWSAVGRLMQAQWGIVKNLTKSTAALIAS